VAEARLVVLDHEDQGSDYVTCHVSCTAYSTSGTDSSSPSMTAAGEERETDELKEFRENWKREVWGMQRASQSSVDPVAASPTQAPSPEGRDRTSGRLQLRNDALDVYARAVQHEQASELDDALRLYRQAFRMDANVDIAYHLREQRTAQALEISAIVAATSVQLNAENRVMGSISPIVDGGVVHVKSPPSSSHHPERQVSGLLARIVADFPMPLSFEPEDEREPSYLQRLPDELLIHVLRYLSTTAIERFARVCRKARIIALDMTIWRSDFLSPPVSFAHSRLSIYLILLVFQMALCTRCHRRNSHHTIFYRSFVEMIYKPPQISPDEDLDDIVDHYCSDYRRVYIARPRVRTDGVYIAVCHYMYLLANVAHSSYHSLKVADDTD
jgi:F-box protein 9